MPNIVQQNPFDKIVAMREASCVKKREVKIRKRENHLKRLYPELLQKFMNYYTKCNSYHVSPDVTAALEKAATRSSYRKICAVAIPSFLGTAYLMTVSLSVGFGVGVTGSTLYATVVGLIQFVRDNDFTWVDAISFLFAKHHEKKRIAEKSVESFPHEVTF